MAGSPSRAAGRRLQLPLLCLFLQGATAVLFAVFVRYNHKTDAALWHRSNHSNADNEFYFRYPKESHSVAQAGVQRRNLGSLQPSPPRLPGRACHGLRGLWLPHGLPAALRLQQRGLHLPPGRLCPAVVHTGPGLSPLLPRWPHPCWRGEHDQC
ncbi:Rh family B glycoprotein [Homo sapiens]|uniref:Rh family B glycoprotein n=1 Tax=Homo sapiens TaxID=9606 RepID=A0A087WTF7_HUMAN|nr:Rh family B glycoprotein [Homo sapiens]